VAVAEDAKKSCLSNESGPANNVKEKLVLGAVLITTLVHANLVIGQNRQNKIKTSMQAKFHDVRDYFIPNGYVAEIQRYTSHLLDNERPDSFLLVREMQALIGAAIYHHQDLVLLELDTFARNKKIPVYKVGVQREIYAAECRWIRRMNADELYGPFLTFDDVSVKDRIANEFELLTTLYL
jgi:hypothetical protein